MKRWTLIFLCIISKVIFGQNLVFEPILTDILKDYEIYSINENHLNEIVLATNQGILVFDGVNIRSLKQENKAHLDFFHLARKKDKTLYALDIDGGIYRVELDSIIEIQRYKKTSSEIGYLFVNEDDELTYVTDFEDVSELKINEKIKCVPDFYFAMNIKSHIIGVKRNKGIYLDNREIVGFNETVHAFVFNERYYYKEIKDSLYTTIFEIDTFGNRKEFHQLNFENFKYDFRPSKELLYINDSEKGVLVYDKNFELLDSNSLDNLMISKSFSGNYGREWLGTFTNGLFCLANRSADIYDYHEELLDIDRHEDRVLISTKSNKIIEFTNKEFLVLDSLKFDFRMLKIPGDPEILILKMFLGSNYIYSKGKLEKLKHRYYWIQDINDSVKLGLYREGILALGKDKNKNVLEKYNYLNLNTKDNSPLYVLPRNRHETLYYDSLDLSIITGGIDDIVIEYPNRKKLDTIRYLGKSIHCSAIIPFSDKFLLYTKHDGLYIMKDKKIYRHLSKSNYHVLSNNIKKIDVYKNHVFIAHNYGVEILDSTFNRVRVIRKSDGLLSQRVSEFTILEDDLYVVSEGKLVVIPWRINQNIPPTLHQPIVYCNEKEIASGTELDYSKNHLLSFNFKGIDVLNPELLGYEYRIIGLSDKWEDIRLGEPGKVTLFGLEFGEYELEVKAVNTDEEQSEVKRFTFTILPPYYSTWWFRILLVLIFFSILYLVFKFYSDKKEKEFYDNQLKKQLAESQLSALRSQMNPHFIFNALNSIQSYIMLQDKMKAGHYLKIFSNLIREYLMQSRKNKISLEEEVSSLRLYLQLEKLRFESSLNYELSVNIYTSLDDIFLPSLLIQPFVENAFKHGVFHKKDNKLITIDFSLNEHKNILICKVQDNGIGREKAKLYQKNKGHHSIGISNTKRRLALLNKNFESPIGLEIIDLFNDNKKATGTLVVLKIPIL